MLSKLLRLILAAALLPVTLAGAQPVFQSGLPSLVEGFEMTQWREGDRFTCNEATTLTHVRFWEMDGLAASFSGSFVWELRANSATNTPGVLLYTGSSQNLQRSTTGRFAFVHYPEYVNTFELPGIPVAAGSYWLVLHHGPLSHTASQQIYWQTAISTSTDPSFADKAPFASQWRANGVGSRLAFQLFGIAESSRPRVAVARQNVPRIAFTTVEGATYSVEYKDNMLLADWTPLPGGGNVAGTGAEVQVNDTTAEAGTTRRFYRVTMQAAPPPPPPQLPATPARSSLSSSIETAPNTFSALVQEDLRGSAQQRERAEALARNLQ